MSNRLVIQSHKGPYAVEFVDEPFAGIAAEGPQKHYIIDSRVATLYREQLAGVLASRSVLLVEAKEGSKSLELCSDYVVHLMACGIKRGHVLVAIGGGIVQDITCFLAAVLLRGVEWHFYPTSLLAQADSCIGSKSSINVGPYKNVVGTYTPPVRIVLCPAVLSTLPETEIRSGVGEMLKVHAIAGPDAFDRIAADYSTLLADASMMTMCSGVVLVRPSPKRVSGPKAAKLTFLSLVSRADICEDGPIPAASLSARACAAAWPLSSS